MLKSRASIAQESIQQLFHNTVSRRRLVLCLLFMSPRGRSPPQTPSEQTRCENCRLRSYKFAGPCLVFRPHKLRMVYITCMTLLSHPSTVFFHLQHLETEAQKSDGGSCASDVSEARADYQIGGLCRLENAALPKREGETSALEWQRSGRLM